MSPTKIGVLGCGALAQKGALPHLTQPDAAQRLEVVALADADQERASEVARRFDVPRAFDSLDAMLRGSDVDVVCVLTPIAHHFAAAKAAMQAGKHVYVQKTMTTSLAQADELLALRDEMGVRLAAAPGFELFPLVGRMREAVARGDIGPVYLAYSFTIGFGHEGESQRHGESAAQRISPAWYYRRGGGPLPDVSVYGLQLLTSVLGSVRRVSALASTMIPTRQWRDEAIALEVPDNNALLLEFASGTLGIAVGSASHPKPGAPWGGLDLHGALGTLCVSQTDESSAYPTEFEVSGPHARVERAALEDAPALRGGHAHLEEAHVWADIAELLDALEEGRAPRNSGEQARHVVEIIERARQCVETGRTQEMVSTLESR